MSLFSVSPPLLLVRLNMSCYLRNSNTLWNIKKGEYSQRMMPVSSSMVLLEWLNFHMGDWNYLCFDMWGQSDTQQLSLWSVSLTDFLWAQLEIQNNWRQYWVRSQVPVERGDTWRWLFNMCLVSLFWGFIGRESQTCMAGNLILWECPLAGVKYLELHSCLQDFILVSVRSQTLHQRIGRSFSVRPSTEACVHGRLSIFQGCAKWWMSFI